VFATFNVDYLPIMSGVVQLIPDFFLDITQADFVFSEVRGNTSFRSNTPGRNRCAHSGYVSFADASLKEKILRTHCRTGCFVGYAGCQAERRAIGKGEAGCGPRELPLGLQPIESFLQLPAQRIR
jgi:hypothetical protein